MIYDYFRVTGAHDTVLDCADLFSITLRNDDVQEFDTRFFTACIREEADHFWAPLRPGLCIFAPFACVSRRHIHDGTADLVMGHKGFEKFTIGCHTLRRAALVIS